MEMIKIGSLVRVQLLAAFRDIGTLYCQTKKRWAIVTDIKADNKFGLFLGPVGSPICGAKVFIDDEIYHIHPKYLEVVDCEEIHE